MSKTILMAISDETNEKLRTIAFNHHMSKKRVVELFVDMVIKDEAAIKYALVPRPSTEI